MKLCPKCGCPLYAYRGHECSLADNYVPEFACPDKPVFVSTGCVAALAKIVESAQAIAKDLKQSHHFYTSTRVSRVADAAAELQRKIESAATK